MLHHSASVSAMQMLFAPKTYRQRRIRRVRISLQCPTAAVRELKVSFSLSFTPTLRSRSAALDPTCFWPLDVMSRDPFLVVRPGAGCGSGDFRIGSSFHRCGSVLFRLARPVTAASPLGGEIGSDPDGVEEVDSAAEASQ